MKSPERLALEAALAREPAGSAKIQALADYAMLLDASWDVSNAVETRALLEAEAHMAALKVVVEMRAFREDAYEYQQAYDHAKEILMC